MTDAVRTPDPILEGLPDFAFAAHYRQRDGLRLAHVDEGDGAPVVFVHGEPTWSYLWRHVMVPVREAGFRCVAPDHAGFGRSDKPTDVDWYSYDRHTALTGSLLEDLDLRDATVVVHDWGGPIGLRMAVEAPDRVSRLVIMDTGLFTGQQRMTDEWLAFRDFVARTEDIPISLLVRRGCHRDPGDDVAAAYDAPFSQRRVKGRRPRLSADDPPDARGSRGQRRSAGARGPTRGPPTDAHAVGRLRPRAAPEDRGALRGRHRPRRADGHRERRALPAGGPGTRDRAAHRRLADRRLSRSAV